VRQGSISVTRPADTGKAIRIISGGQTGVDRACLAWAIRRGIEHGGWCPRGRLAEDGEIPHRYKLRPTPLARHTQRTVWNVRDSDATVIFSQSGELSGGSLKTMEACREFAKPLLHLAAETFTVAESAMRLHKFLRRHHVRVLNVAGPRKSQEPRTGRFARSVLEATFGFTSDAGKSRGGL
jgi:putative molybdenum carrier protein